MTNQFITVALSLLWVLPLLAAAVVQGLLHDQRQQRSVAIATSWVVFGLALVLLVINGSGHAFARDDVEAGPTFLSLHYHMAIDGLNAVLLPMTAAVALASLLMAPRSDLRGDTTARILVVEATLLGSFLALDAALLSLFWIASMLPLWQDSRRSGSRPLQVIVTMALGATIVALLGAVALLANHGISIGLRAPLDLIAISRAEQAPPALAGWLFLFAGLLRMGIVPLHLWLTAAAARAPGYSAMLALLTPLGSFALARVVIPLFPHVCEQFSTPLVLLGAVTAVYGAVLAAGQHDLRRVLGYFWVSQMGLVLAGLAALNAPSVAGALMQAMSSVVEVGGLMLIALEVEARAGTTDMRLLGGLVRQAPRMATGFLLLSAAAVGFPGTISFVAEDLAIQGLLRQHAIVAGILLVVTAVNGIVLFKAWQRVFLGPPSPHVPALRSFEDLHGWEYLASVAMMGILVVGGLLPEPLLAVRSGVVDALKRIELPAPELEDE
jgi:NADH-quinone oxidoreductase subunit M